MDYDTFALALLIFVAEMCVVTVGTLRIIFVARGHKFVAGSGFLRNRGMAFRRTGVTMKNLHHWPCCAGFAIGFTLGSYLGILIEKWLALGTVIVRIITHRDAAELIEQLRAANFGGVTSVEGQGATEQGADRHDSGEAGKATCREIVAADQETHPSWGRSMPSMNCNRLVKGFSRPQKERPEGIFPRGNFEGVAVLR